MKKRHWHRLISIGLTLAVLVSVILIFPTAALGVTPSVSPGKSTYLLGEPVRLTGDIAFGVGEVKAISSVSLTIAGPQPLQQSLPVSPGHYEYPTNDLTVDVSWVNIGSGYGYGYSYKGLGAGARIAYDIVWDAPVYRDPAPQYEIVPNTLSLFNIPQVSPPPTPTPGGPANLPSATELFSIPQVQVAGPPTGAPAELPTVTQAFAIPEPTVPTPPADVPELGSTALAFAVPGGRTPNGIAYDSANDNFYILVDGTSQTQSDESSDKSGASYVQQSWWGPGHRQEFQVKKSPIVDRNDDGDVDSQDVTVSINSLQVVWVNAQEGRVELEVTQEVANNTPFTLTYDSPGSDQILKTDGSGNLQDTITPSTGGSTLQGIAFLNNALFVADNSGSPKIRKLNLSGTQQSSFSPPESQQEIKGLAPDGNNLWLARADGCGFWKVTQTGTPISTPWSPCSSFQSVAFSKGFLYTGRVDMVTKWKPTSNDAQEENTWEGVQNLSDVRGMTAKPHDADFDILYIADAGGTPSVYKTVPPSGISVTQNPLGMAYDGSNLWVLVDATPKDKLLKLNSDGSIAAQYDAPTGKAAGMTYLSNFLWVAANDDPRKVHRVDPASGTSTVSANIPQSWNDIGGLTNDGTNLVAIGSNNNDIRVFTTSGGDVAGPWPNNYPQNGATGFARRASNNTYLLAKAGTLYVMDSDWNVSGQSYVANPSLTSIQGMTFATETFAGESWDVLYMADVGTQKVYKASIPSGISVTKNPRGMAYGGGALWILVDGTPVDKILKVSVNPGQLLAAYDATSKDTEAIAYLNGQLFVAFNQEDPCCQRSIVVHDATTGDPTGVSFSPGQDDVTGLTSDGTILYTGSKWGGQVRALDSGGNDQGQFWLDGMDGVGTLAYRSANGELFAAKGSKLQRFSGEGGQPLQQWNVTGLTTIRGSAFVGDFIYMADSTTQKVYGANIPTPPVTITQTPKGMTTDGTYLWVIVEASPKDKVLKLDTDGNLLDSFDAPTNDAAAIDYFGTFLYIGGQTGDQWGSEGPRIFKVTTAGVKETAFQVPHVNNPITALTNDGTNLIVGQQWDGKWVLVDPANPQSAQEVWQTPQTFPYMEWPASFAYALGNLYGAKGNLLNQFNKSNGNTQNSWQLQGSVPNVTGMAYIGATLYLADASTNSVRGTTFPENTPEATIIGSYDATLAVQAGGQTKTDVDSFTIQKITDVVVEITQPADQATFTTGSFTVTGRLNDPAFAKTNTKVKVGVDLPFTFLFEDDTDQAGSAAKYTKTGLWHIADVDDWPAPFFPKAASPPKAWYYGKNDTRNYDTGGINSGALQLVGPNANGSFSIGSSDTDLEFKTWWDTESGAEYDRKLVQVSTNGGATWQNIAMILPPFDIDFQSGQPFFVPLDLQGQNIQWKAVPQANFAFGGFGGGPFGGPGPTPVPGGGGFGGGGGGGPIFDNVGVDLGAFVSQDIHIRFFFHTVDAEVNELEGWYIDGVKIAGSGFLGAEVDVTPITDASLQAQGWFGTFQTDSSQLGFTLAEGENEITARAESPYSDLVDTDAVTVYLDTQDPIVSVEFDVTSPTSVTTATVTATAEDINLVELVVTHQKPGQDPKPFINEKNLQESLGPCTKQGFTVTCSKQVSLVEGVNVFEATGKDGGGRTGSGTAQLVVDLSGPTLTVLAPAYPIGVQSARPGDPVIFAVEADDGDGSGVDRVEIVFPGGPGQQEEVGRLIPAGEIPEAVLDLWDVDPTPSTDTASRWVLPVRVPETAPAGQFSLTIRGFDNAGKMNDDPAAVVAAVVPSLEGFRFSLMPNWNLISLPLIPTGADTDNAIPVTDLLPTGGLTALEKIWRYDAATSTWEGYDPTADPQANDLTTVKPGIGYWLKLDPDDFQESAALGPGLPPTPKPIKLDYLGSFLQAGNAAPPVYDVVKGWNLAGFHSENELLVSTYLGTLEAPVRIWGSLLQYNNRILFEIPDAPEEEPTFEIFLGAFQRLLGQDTMTPGFGYWLFVTAEAGGQIVP